MGRSAVGRTDMLYRELFAETPYAAALADEQLDKRCSNCFKNGATIRCDGGYDGDGCGRVVYCSDACRDTDRPQHQHECAVLKNAKDIDETVRLLGRILTRQSIDGGFANLSENFPANIPNRRLIELLSHEEDMQSDSTLASTVQRFQEAFENTPLVRDSGAVKRMYCVMVINCFQVSVSLNMISGVGSYLGISLYLNASRFNHACNPRLGTMFDLARIVVLYPSTIFTDNEANEAARVRERSRLTESADTLNQLTISYGYAHGTAFFPLRQTRRSSLKESYFFKCRCDLCKNKRAARLETDAAAIECPKCDDPYVWKKMPPRWIPCCHPSVADKPVYKCRKSCDCELNTEELAKIEPFLSRITEDEEEAYEQLAKKWLDVTSFDLQDSSLKVTDVIQRCEPVWEEARRFWHRAANLRMTHLQERIFVCTRQHLNQVIKAQGGPVDRRLLKLALTTGESSIAWYMRNLSPICCDTAVAPYSYLLAQAYEIGAGVAESPEDAADMYAQATKWFEFAASFWAAYGRYTERFVRTLMADAERTKAKMAEERNTKANVVAE